MSATEWPCTSDEYHADPRVGTSMLKTLLVSPAEYHARYIARTIVDRDSPALRRGLGVHCGVLEPSRFDEQFTVRPEGIDGRTKEGKVALAEWRESAAGKTELTPEELVVVKGMAAAVLAHPLVAELLSKAVIERGVVWQEGGIDLKARPDVFIPRPWQESDLILDLKTAADPSPEEWRRSGQFCPIQRYRYDLQAAHYTTGMSLLTGRPCGFGLVVVGVSPPHDVYCYDLASWLDIGHAWRTRALKLLAACRESGDWTRPEQREIVPLVPSIWDEPNQGESSE